MTSLDPNGTATSCLQASLLWAAIPYYVPLQDIAAVQVAAASADSRAGALIATALSEVEVNVSLQDMPFDGCVSQTQSLTPMFVACREPTSL